MDPQPNPQPNQVVEDQNLAASEQLATQVAPPIQESDDFFLNPQVEEVGQPTADPANNEATPPANEEQPPE